MLDEDANKSSGTLFEKDMVWQSIPTEVLQALGSFFSAREWTPEAQQTRTVAKYKHTEVISNSTNVTTYKVYRTNKDRGAQCWRTDNSRKESERRDTSWVFVSLRQISNGHHGRLRWLFSQLNSHSIEYSTMRKRSVSEVKQDGL